MHGCPLSRFLHKKKHNAKQKNDNSRHVSPGGAIYAATMLKLFRHAFAAFLLLSTAPAWPQGNPELPTSAQTQKAKEKLNQPMVGNDLPTSTLDEVVVRAEAESQGYTQDPFLEGTQEGKIFTGKKASVLDLDAFPQVQANNYRQALALTPGLLYSEETTPLVSIGSRGIGEPHRMQFLQVLKDGIPIHADPFGYPEAYYTPPLDVVDRIEFVRGGSSLLYGSQPAGSLNYVTYMPDTTRPFNARSQHIFGSDGLYSTYNSIDGTIGRTGYLAYYNHRESDGFREANSDYVLDGGAFKIVLDGTERTRWILNMDAYEEEHGEPGGLTFETGPGAVNYNENRDGSSREHDRFRLRRYIPSLTIEHDADDDTQYVFKTWGGYYQRFSKRQRGGGFGILPAGPTSETNDIENQEFYNFGADARASHRWYGLGGENTLTGGFLVCSAYSPRIEERGDEAGAEEGIVFRDSDRYLNSGSLFVENEFKWGAFSLVPAFRLEMISQSVDTKNFDPVTGNFINSDEKEVFEAVPLVGLGAKYQLTPTTELYANVSQGYRTTIFTEALVVPTSGTYLNNDIEPNTSWTYETGYRGKVNEWFVYDTSFFLVDLDNKFGGTTVAATGDTVLRNVGRTINYGWDAAVEIDAVSLFDVLSNGLEASQKDPLTQKTGSFKLYANTELLRSEIYGGVADGFRAQYTPEYLLRTGVIYNFRDRVKLAFLGTFVGDHWADDTETANRLIPSYMTWDLTGEVKVYKDYVTLMAGLQNVFDEDYYSRVRSDGIDPAYGRNFYAGFRLSY